MNHTFRLSKRGTGRACFGVSYTMAVEKPEEFSEQPESGVEELKANTGKIAQSARAQMEEIDRDFDSKLQDMGNKISSGRNRYEASKTKPANNSSGLDPESSRSLGTGLTVAYAIIGVPLFGWGVGMMIDHFTQNNTPGSLQWASVLALIGAVLGVTFAVVVAGRMNK